MRRNRRRVLAVALNVALAAIVLSACTWDPGTIVRTPRENVTETTNAKSRLAARKGASNGAQQAVPGDTDIPGTEVAALEVDLTNFKERLIGLDSDEINDLMGTPGLERAEPPALIWQYRHQVCTVDIFMFDDGGGATVDHVEVRPTSGGAVNEKDCFTALLRQAPQSGGASSAKAPASAPSAAPGQQPISASPSTPVTRRPGAGAPASAPAPSTSRPPTPSTAAPSAAPATPRAAAPAATDGEDGPSPEDTDVDFDFGGATPPQNAAPRPPASSSAAPSSEEIPTIPGDPPPNPSIGTPGPSSSLLPKDIPIDDDAGDFTDPLSDAAPPTATAKPAAPTAKPAPAPVASAPATAKPAPAPSIAPPAPAAPPAPVTPSAPPPIVAAPVTPPAPPGPAQLAPPPARTAAATNAAPKGAPKRSAPQRTVEDIDDEDLPPDLLRGRRDDDPANTNDDLVE